MAIRIRKVDGILIAICAARSIPKEEDIYLGDDVHHALTNKFAEDFNSEGWEGLIPMEEIESNLRAIEESNNINREWWDKTYGS